MHILNGSLENQFKTRKAHVSRFDPSHNLSYIRKDGGGQKAVEIVTPML